MPHPSLTDSPTTQSGSDAAYRAAGVDLHQADVVVSLAKQAAARTLTSHITPNVGGFSGGFELPEGYRQPVVLTACDGVGTKLKLAFDANRHNTVGIDLVAMNVNDILVSGGQPLAFLDYLATSAIAQTPVKEILEGIATGCQYADCALVGGETAEMPGFYAPGEYDLAGFCVGVAEKATMLPRLAAMAEGNVLIGLGSNGFHSNGYSLVRKICFQDNGLKPDALIAELGNTPLIDHLIAPTRIYVKPVLACIQAFPDTIVGMAHITGGGFYDNLNRVLPDHLTAELDSSQWPLPPVMQWLQQLGKLDNPTLWHTFNAGIGFVLVVPAEKAAAVKTFLEEEAPVDEQGPLAVYTIGTIKTRASDTVPQVTVR